MKRAHRIGAVVVVMLTLTGTAILVNQFRLDRPCRPFEDDRYEEAISEYRDLLSRLGDGRYIEAAKNGPLACAYNRVASLDVRMARIERRLEVMAKVLASKSRDDAVAPSRKFATVGRVLDSDTLAPIKGVQVTFPNSGGGSRETDASGIFLDSENRLLQGRELCLHHPDYDIQREKNYKLDSTSMVTFLMEKQGDASLVIEVSLTVRGKKTDSRCRVALSRSGKYEKRVRCIQDSDDNTYQFSDLAPGEYVIDALFIPSSYMTCYKAVQLAKGEHKVVEINAKTDLLPRVEIRALVLNKRDGKPMKGVMFHCWGDSAVTGEDGAFSVAAGRAGFHQASLSLGEMWRVSIPLDHQISEELAKKLEFHLDPDVGYNGDELMDTEEDGIFCDENGCVVCQKHRGEMAK